MQLADAERGDTYRATDHEFDTTFEDVRIISVRGQLTAVIDYIAIGPVDDIPEPWASFEWEKVA